MLRSCFVVATLLLTLGACGSADTPSGPSMEAFCEQLADQTCEAHARCCNDPAMVYDGCPASVRSYCMEWVVYRKEEANAIVLSHTAYRSGLAEQLLETVGQAFAACEPVSVPLADVFFAPRLSVGSRCAISSGCPSGTYCYGKGGGTGVCRQPPDSKGAFCGLVGGTGPCAGGLVCGEGDQCAEPLALGEACTRPEHCASGICTADDRCGECVVRSDGCAGAECELWCPFDLVCQDSACVTYDKGALREGEPCEASDQCASHRCDDVCRLADVSAPNDYCMPDLIVPSLWT